jgi:hypothetical protein
MLIHVNIIVQKKALMTSKHVRAQPVEALKRLGHEKLAFDEYESVFTDSCPRLLQTSHIPPERIASEVVHPDDIGVKFTGMSCTLV